MKTNALSKFVASGNIKPTPPENLRHNKHAIDADEITITATNAKPSEQHVILVERRTTTAPSVAANRHHKTPFSEENQDLVKENHR